MRGPAKQRGFATAVAIILIGLVAVALGVLGDSALSQFRQTARVRQEAQLRQLLLAGAASVRQHSRQWGSDPAGDFSVPLPASVVADAAVAVHVAGRGERAQANVTARMNGQSMTQRLEFARPAGVGGGWTIVSASLSGW